MGITNQIKALLSIRNMRMYELMEPLGASSRQSLSNKFSDERWSAKDLVKIAEITGTKLAFILPNGERIMLDNNENADNP